MKREPSVTLDHGRTATASPRQDGEYKMWLKDLQCYLIILQVLKKNKCQSALLATGGAVGQFVFRLTSNNVQLTWDELRVALEEYYGKVSEFANIKQGRTEGTQDYAQRVRLAESPYMGVDRGN